MMSLVTNTLVYAGFAAWSLVGAAAVGYWAVRSLAEPLPRTASTRIRERRTCSADARADAHPAVARCA